MSAVAKIAFDPRTASFDPSLSAPVITDFAVASQPQGEIAQRLMAEAAASSAKVGIDNRAGKLRLISSGRPETFAINPYLLKVRDDWNSRNMNDPDNIAHIDWLARSIAKDGVLEALTVNVEGDDVFVDNGHCRLLGTFRAIEVYGAEIKSVNCRPESRQVKAAERIANQIIRNSGKPFSVMEYGTNFVKLEKLGWSVAQIAEKVQMGEVRVKQILDLMADSSDAMKTMIIEGFVAPTQAAETLREVGGDTELAEQVLTEAVTIAKAAGKKRATKKHVEKAMGGAAKLSIKSALRGIFEGKSTQVDTSGRGVAVVTLSKGDWTKVKALLGIIATIS